MFRIDLITEPLDSTEGRECLEQIMTVQLVMNSVTLSK
jgi:hypothetical protein